jgi:hypothetical protein
MKMSEYDKWVTTEPAWRTGEDDSTFTLQVTVRKRSDMDEPTNAPDAIRLVEALLTLGSFIEIVEITEVEQ